MESGEDYSLLAHKAAEGLHDLVAVRKINGLLAQTCDNLRNGIGLTCSRSTLKNDTFLVFKRVRDFVVISRLHIVVNVYVFTECVCCGREFQEVLLLDLT